MATAAFPDALPTLADVPSLMALSPNHETQHDQVNAETVAIATLLGTRNSSTVVQRFTTDAARDLALTAPSNGMIVVSGEKLQIRQGGLWRVVWEPPVEVSTGFTVFPGWSLGIARGTKLNGIVSFYAQITRTGATIGVPSSGALGNSPVLTIPPGLRGNGNRSGLHGSDSVISAFEVNPVDGEVSLTATMGSTDIITGSTFTISGTWITT